MATQQLEFTWLFNGKEHYLIVTRVGGWFKDTWTAELNGVNRGEWKKTATDLKHAIGKRGTLLQFDVGSLNISLVGNLTATGAPIEVDCFVNEVRVSSHKDGSRPTVVDQVAEPISAEVNTSKYSPSTGDSGGVVRQEKIVERQVLVVRCKFCAQITPVDLNNCEKCGAAAFS